MLAAKVHRIIDRSARVHSCQNVPMHRGSVLIILVAGTFLAGCSTSYYKKSADKEVYKILAEKEPSVLGKTNDFSINTEYSGRDPNEVKALEIMGQRLEAGSRKLNVSEALDIAVRNSRNYQFRKESLFLAALNLTRDRYDFRPKFFAASTASFNRESTGEKTAGVHTAAGVDQLLKSGGSFGLHLANDLLRYYTGDPRRTAVSVISANLVQPLLRGAGAAIVGENLTQSERNVVYEIRSFSRFQRTFAVDIVTTFYRLLQQKDAVRNEYNNYKTLVLARDRAESLAKRDLPEFQVDQARQDELRAKSRYILAVENYQTRLDQFKTNLGLPLGIEVFLDDSALIELNAVGLMPVSISEEAGYKIAVAHRLDLLSEIDRFEDSKRKVKVAANQLKAEVNIVADASWQSQPPADYAKFDFNQYHASAGLQLNLPIERLPERNNYRATLINFERQIRALALALDGVRNDVREGLRTLDQARQGYQIQKMAVDLADRRVESANLLLEAGRAQIRDLLEAQSAQLEARNALSQGLVDYHAARLGLLINMEMLDTSGDRFWLREQPIAAGKDSPVPEQRPQNDETVIPPDQLFER